MGASIEKPVYYIKVVSGKTTYNLRPAITALELSQPEKDIAQKLTFTCSNVKVDGKYLKNLIGMGQKVYITYDSGSGKKEKFRGEIWATKSKDDVEKEVSFIAYDNLIYLQESKDSFYFSKGKSTKAVISSICKKWGIKLSYNYKSITHPKLALHSKNLSDIIIDLLEDVRLKTGAKYCVRSIKGVLHINLVGKNSTVYHIRKKQNLMSTSVEKSKSGMITKVVIRGPQDKKGKTSVKAVIKGKTSKYGTLQDEVSKSKDTSMKEVRKEAKEIISEKGTPFVTRKVEDAVDNPNINRGDKVHIVSGNMNGNYYVLSIEHDAVKRTMNLEVKSI